MPGSRWVVFPSHVYVAGVDCRCASFDIACVADVTRFYLIRQGSMEEQIMRKAFDTPEGVYLPQHILYRQEEQFSDGLGYDGIDELRAKAANKVGMATFCFLSLCFVV